MTEQPAEQQPTDPSTEPSAEPVEQQPAADPGNTDPEQLVAPLDPDDDVLDRLRALPGSDQDADQPADE